MTKKAKKRSVIILVIILVIISIGLYKILMNDSHGINVIDKIDGYNYILNDNDSKLTKTLFSELKSELKSSNIDRNKYAEYIAKLFVVDLYTMNTKINKYDVGGDQFVYPKYLDNYKLKVRDTLYKYLEESSFRDKDTLPEVSEISLVSIEDGEFENNKTIYESILVNLEWNYKKELGYDSKGSVVLIEDNGQLYVVQYLPEVSE